MLSHLEKIVNYLALRTSQVAQAALAAVMLVIVANIVMRALWKPLTGSYELVEIMGALLLSLGLAYCAVHRGHVTVTLLVDSLPNRWQGIVDTLTNTISLVFISLISWGLIQYAETVHRRNLSTSSLDIPVFPVYYLVALGMIMLALTTVIELARSIKTAIHGRKPE